MDKASKMRHLKRRTLVYFLLLLVVFGPIVRVAVLGFEYIFVLPYSQFAYPLEADFDQLFKYYNAHGVYPGHIHAINNDTFPTLHSGERLCSQPQRQAKQLHLLILVKSSISNRAFRDAARASWVNRLSYNGKLNMRHAFVLGAGASEQQQARINAEQSIHGDIVQQGFVDAYFNNTYKTMFAFDWATRHCPSAAFVLFADDDYYVSPTNLALLIQQLWTQRGDNLALGYVFTNAVPKRSRFSVWYTSLSEYPYAFWPPYPTGGAVLATSGLCRRVSAVQRFVKYLRFDDVFLGIVMHKLGLHPNHHGLFYYELLTPLKREVYQHVIAMHLDKQIDLLQQIWQAMNYTWYDVPVNSLAGRGLL